MAIVVVGGQTRNIGKTSVVEGIIAALPQSNWVAFKVSEPGHGIDDALTVIEERETEAGTDSARFLRAGAMRSFWVRPQPEKLAEAMPQIRKELAAAENAIFESNSILNFLQPDLYLAVLNFSVADFKPSALEFLHRADAVLLTSPPELRLPTHWPMEVQRAIASKRLFRMAPPSLMSAELKNFFLQHIAPL